MQIQGTKATRHKGNEAQRHEVIQGKEAIGKEAKRNTEYKAQRQRGKRNTNTRIYTAALLGQLFLFILYLFYNNQLLIFCWELLVVNGV